MALIKRPPALEIIESASVFPPLVRLRHWIWIRWNRDRYNGSHLPCMPPECFRTELSEREVLAKSALAIPPARPPFA